MSNLSGPFAKARREVALVKEKIVSEAIRGALDGSIPDRLNGLLYDGVIDRTQYHALFFTDPRRADYEITLIEELEDKGVICADNIPLFEEIQQEGSKYFFENFSPMTQRPDF